MWHVWSFKMNFSNEIWLYVHVHYVVVLSSVFFSTQFCANNLCIQDQEFCFINLFKRHFCDSLTYALRVAIWTIDTRLLRKLQDFVEICHFLPLFLCWNNLMELLSVHKCATCDVFLHRSVSHWLGALMELNGYTLSWNTVQHGVSGIVKNSTHCLEKQSSLAKQLI